MRRRGLRSAEQARACWEERWFPLETIDRLAEAQRRGPGVLAERASRELLRLFAAPRRGAASVLGAEEMDEARALAGGRSALSELRELVRFAPGSAPSSAAELAAVLAAVEVNSGALPGAGLVAVLDPLATARATRAGAVPVRPAGGRVPVCAPARSRCSASASAGVWHRPPVCCSATAARSSTLSATCSTPCSRVPRSCSC